MSEEVLIRYEPSWGTKREFDLLRAVAEALEKFWGSGQNHECYLCADGGQCELDAALRAWRDAVGKEAKR